MNSKKKGKMSIIINMVKSPVFIQLMEGVSKCQSGCVLQLPCNKLHFFSLCFAAGSSFKVQLHASLVKPMSHNPEAPSS